MSLSGSWWWGGDDGEFRGRGWGWLLWNINDRSHGKLNLDGKPLHNESSEILKLMLKNGDLFFKGKSGYLDMFQ